MKRFVPICLTGLFLFVTYCPADPSRESPPPEEQCERILTEWSRRSKEIRSLYAEYDLCLVQGDQELRIPGSMRFLKPGMARQDCVGDNATTVIVNASVDDKKPFLYHYPEAVKLPNGMTGGALLQHHVMPFVFLPDLPLAQRYYRMELIAATDTQAHFVMWRQKDRLPPDQAEFIVEEVEVLLDRKSYVPQKIRIGNPKSNHLVYEFKGVWTNIEINEEDFVPKLVQGKPGEPDWRAARKQNANEEK